ncbi:MAG TPA: TusE/DsrC/DsvC family sulfur relay protein [Xanthomonadales bacterium]|nr:TusE/DsrC/DsvC family sulfur relay protein [Xanthomonadales bacterium]
MSDGELILADGRRLSIDEKGYLVDQETWDIRVAEHMAQKDGIILTDDHLQVLKIFQGYFDAYEIEPPMRALVKLVAGKMGSEKGNSRFLYRLFPQGPVLQASRYAGLPRPLSCI